MTISDNSIDVRILLAGRWDGLLSDIVDVLQREPQFEIIGPCETYLAAIRQVLCLSPQVTLIDMASFDSDPFQTAVVILSISHNCRVLFLGDHPTDDQINTILAIRAHGLVCETRRPAAVLAAVGEVASGGMSFCESIRSRLIIASDGIRLGRVARQDG